MADTSDLLGEFPHAGDIWPIRIGPGDDHSRADIDLPALREKIGAERDQIEAEHLRLGLERGASPGRRENDFDTGSSATGGWTAISLASSGGR